jgi:hypothetical protein
MTTNQPDAPDRIEPHRPAKVVEFRPPNTEPRGHRGEPKEDPGRDIAKPFYCLLAYPPFECIEGRGFDLSATEFGQLKECLLTLRGGGSITLSKRRRSES